MHSDLLGQAALLADIDPKRPKQANLRRAVSTAYYALFHFFLDQAWRTFLGTQNDVRVYRDVLARAFDHGCMKDACSSFAGGTLPKSVSKGLPSSFRVPHDLQDVAATFVEAQEKRHLADYDRSERFTRSDVKAFVQQIHSAMGRFEATPDVNLRRFFLACLLTWKTLARR
ncbi:MAG: hypothetical protein HYX69_21940 [Planctomycetia bacterium]|nr:hypothetical protein [Planctomycetia bacterium]